MYKRQVFGQPIEDTVGRFWGDKIAADRRINAIDLAIKVQDKLDEAGITEIHALPNKVSVPLIEAATLEDNPDIKKMFVNLLASALNPSEEQIEKKYVSVLSEMSGNEAVLIKFLFAHKYTENAYPGRQSVSWGIKQYNVFKLGDLKRYANANEDDVRSLMRLGILKSIPIEMKLDYDSSRRSLSGTSQRSTKFGVYPDAEQTSFTQFGIDLITRVIAVSYTHLTLPTICSV